MAKNYRMSNMQKKVLFILTVSIVFFNIDSYAVQFAVMESPNATQLKALELTIQMHQFFLAVIGAMFAYLLASGQSIISLFDKSCNCLKKFSVISTSLLLVVTATMLIWNLYTLTNQLRNDFQNLNELISENIYFGSLALAILFFLPTIYSIWREK